MISEWMDKLEERPSPPPKLYKYVVPARTDVLIGSSIRFTPLLNTNDTFEVRQTFDLVAGDKMRALFEEQLEEVDPQEQLDEALAEMPLAGLVPGLREALSNPDFLAALKSTTGAIVRDRIIPGMNSPEWIERLLDQLASKHICLSLSERWDCSPMWAHYAQNSEGFVIEFDTSSPFFRVGEAKDRQGLQKVSYFDGRVGEVLDDPYVALISKQKDWEYEREWRLYVPPETSATVLQAGDQEIRLVSFPKAAVTKVIVGVRSSGVLIDSLRSLVRDEYPHAALVRLSADRRTATYEQTPL